MLIPGNFAFDDKELELETTAVVDVKTNKQANKQVVNLALCACLVPTGVRGGHWILCCLSCIHFLTGEHFDVSMNSYIVLLTS